MNLLTRNAKCAVCGKPMTILIGMGAPGLFQMETTYKWMKDGVMHGCFQCSECERYYCWNCSDADKPCRCGKSDAWKEHQYLDAAFAKKLQHATNSTGSAGVVRKSRLAWQPHPGITLLVALVFYVVSVCGLATGQMVPKPGKTIWFVAECVPALRNIWQHQTQNQMAF